MHNTRRPLRILSAITAATIALTFAPLAAQERAAVQEVDPVSPSPEAASGADLVADARAASPEWPFRLPAGTHEPRDLVNLVAKQLQRNILTDSTLQGQPRRTIELQVPIVCENRLALDKAFSQLLYHSGLAAIPLSGDKSLWEVISMEGPRRGEVPLRATAVTAEQANNLSDVYIPVSCTVALEHVNANVAANALRPIFARGTPYTELLVSSVDQSPLMLHNLPMRRRVSRARSTVGSRPRHLGPWRR